jgi:predicted deacetylase
MKPIPEHERPTFLIALHDVAPVSWPLYRDFLDQLADLAGLRYTLLVVPHFHRGLGAGEDADFRTAMALRQTAGDELVLHGFTHTDDAPAPKRPADMLRRRVLTHEGEFAALSEAEARQRIAAGLALCQREGWRVAGFVPPGWIASAGSRRAIRAAGFAYRTDSRAFYVLPEEQRLVMPTLVMSSRSAWRRRLFAWLNRWRLWRYRHQPVIRLALHPVDLRFADSRRFWLTLIRRLHGERRGLTKRQWLAEIRGRRVA